MPEPTFQSATHRFDTIDLLRGISILLVVFSHTQYIATHSGLSLALPIPSLLRDMLFKTSGYGVQCFFAISGFLITLTSIRRFGSLRQMVPQTFYKIRFARIEPLLLLLLCVLSILHLANLKEFHILPQVATLPRAVFAALTFHFNWLQAAHGWFPPTWGVLWTLSVEETFYVIYPLICWLLLKRSWGRTVFFCILAGLILVGPFARTPYYTTNEIWHLQSYLGNMDNIAMGCLFGLLASHLGKNSRLAQSFLPHGMQALGAALMLLVFLPFISGARLLFLIQQPMWVSQTNMTVLGIGTNLVMLGSVLRPAQGSVLTSPFRWFGRHSYEVYLTHQFVLLGMAMLLSRTNRSATPLWFCITVALTGVLGMVVARFFSEPMNKMLRAAMLPQNG
jgi:peptidoglycan/LPS O-acetylase OafA/YrhL